MLRDELHYEPEDKPQVISRILRAATVNKRHTFTDIASALSESGFVISASAVSRWRYGEVGGDSYPRWPAMAAWILSHVNHLGGLTYQNHPVPRDTDFVDLLRILTRTSADVGLSSAGLARVLKLAGQQHATKYLRDIDHAKRNLTLVEMDAWARVVGLGHVMLPDFVPRWESGRNTELKPTLVRAPVKAGVRAPLCKLIKILSVERRMQEKLEQVGRLTRPSLVQVADHETILAWENLKLLFLGRASRHDLTLGRLDEWSRTLGFGGIVDPQLGGLGWHDAKRAMFDRATSLQHNLRLMVRPANLEAVWGKGWRRYVGMDWHDMPATHYEYLSVWAFGEGLALANSAGLSGVDMADKGWTFEQMERCRENACLRLREQMARRAANNEVPPLRDFIGSYGTYARECPWTKWEFETR